MTEKEKLKLDIFGRMVYTLYMYEGIVFFYGLNVCVFLSKYRQLHDNESNPAFCVKKFRFY